MTLRLRRRQLSWVFRRFPKSDSVALDASGRGFLRVSFGTNLAQWTAPSGAVPLAGARACSGVSPSQSAAYGACRRVLKRAHEQGPRLLIRWSWVQFPHAPYQITLKISALCVATHFRIFRAVFNALNHSPGTRAARMATIQRHVSKLTGAVSYSAQVRTKGRRPEFATFPNRKDARDWGPAARSAAQGRTPPAR